MFLIKNKNTEKGIIIVLILGITDIDWHIHCCRTILLEAKIIPPLLLKFWHFSLTPHICHFSFQCIHFKSDEHSTLMNHLSRPVFWQHALVSNGCTAAFIFLHRGLAAFNALLQTKHAWTAIGDNGCSLGSLSSYVCSKIMACFFCHGNTINGTYCHLLNTVFLFKICK